MIVSIDLETTGVDPMEHQILEIGAVAENGETFNCVVTHPTIRGDAFALQMNVDLLRILSGVTKCDVPCFNPDAAGARFVVWLQQFNQKIVPAGKNFAGFDRQFLKQLDPRIDTYFHFRVIDVGNLYWSPIHDGDTLPSLATCKLRAGLGSDVIHRALQDARDVLDLVIHYRETYCDRV